MDFGYKYVFVFGCLHFTLKQYKMVSRPYTEKCSLCCINVALFNLFQPYPVNPVTCMLCCFYRLVYFQILDYFSFVYTGKSYKSKVCFTKHLWEHSIYWETFDGVKNQERVLSIQAAIILSNPLLEFLLVTSPSPADKKKEEIKPSPVDNKQQLKKKRKRPYVTDL